MLGFNWLQRRIRRRRRQQQLKTVGTVAAQVGFLALVGRFVGMAAVVQLVSSFLQMRMKKND